MIDKTQTALDLLDGIAEHVYTTFDMTREQLILALTGVMRRVEERSQEEAKKIDAIIKDVEGAMSVMRKTA